MIDSTDFFEKISPRKAPHRGLFHFHATISLFIHTAV